MVDCRNCPFEYKLTRHEKYRYSLCGEKVVIFKIYNELVSKREIKRNNAVPLVYSRSPVSVLSGSSYPCSFSSLGQSSLLNLNLFLYRIHLSQFLTQWSLTSDSSHLSDIDRC